MKLGFTGSRDGMTDYQVAIFEGLLERMESFHHGSCEGADVQAARIIKKAFLVAPRIVAHPGPNGDIHREASGVDDETREPKMHFARNRDIVNETDKIIACPKSMENQNKGGTWYTINYAVKQGKEVTIITPEGGIETRKQP